MRRTASAAWPALLQPPPQPLAALLPGLAWHGAQPLPRIRQLTGDARQVQPGSLFAAWRGTQHDAHAFIPLALQRGARAILSERPLSELPPAAVAWAVVPQARAALGAAAQRFYGDVAAQLQLLGVTGTNGKTSCVRLLQHIFNVAQRPAASLGTLGANFATHTVATGLTTPACVDLHRLLYTLRQAGAQVVALEASSQALAQERLAGLQMDVALCINLSQDHLDYHGSMAAYAAAKQRLVTQHLKTAGWLVVNLQAPQLAAWCRLPALRQRQVQLSGFYDARSAPPPAALLRRLTQPPVVLRDVQASPNGMTLQLEIPQPLQLQSTWRGNFNVENILACVSAALALGVPVAAIAPAVASATPPPGRLQEISSYSSGLPWVVVDYAHTPEALRQALLALRPLCRGKLGVVFGCGGNRDASKRPLMGRLAAQLADWVIVTNDNPRHEDAAAIAAAVLQGASQVAGAAAHCRVILARHDAIATAVARCAPQDALLIAGKGHETGQQCGARTLPFDDAQVARAALQALAPAGDVCCP